MRNHKIDVKNVNPVRNSSIHNSIEDKKVSAKISGISNGVNEILVIALSGIGENLLLIPTLRQLRNIFPKAKINLAVRFKEVISLLKKGGIVDNFIVCDYKIQNTLIKRIRLIKSLREKKFDITILTFPSEKIDKALFSWLISSSVRISHRYKGGITKYFNFLNNYTLAVDKNLHDVEQNLNLLKLFGVKPQDVDKTIEVWLEEKSEKAAKDFLKSARIKNDDLLIAMHPGSSISFGMHYKRWPLEKYKILAKKLVELYRVKVLVFLGYDEPELTFDVEPPYKDNIIFVKEPLDTVCSLLKKCGLFIGNDAALMHLSAVVGIPTIGIFGPTNPSRTGPRGDITFVVRKDLGCSPCYTIERLGRGIYCNFKKTMCLDSISVNDVLNVASNILNEGSKKRLRPMRIILVGPSYPFRGGISHYMTLLYRELKKSHDVKFYAFKRQYPKLFYPGKMDKDISNIAIREEGIENILDSLNPLSWWEIVQKIKRANPELVIFSWWVSFWAPQFWAICSLIKKFTTAKIMFICHNVIEHESRILSKISTRTVLKKGDYFIVHSNEDLNNLTSLLPNSNVKKTFLPTFKVFNFKNIDKQEAKSKLGLEQKTLLFFGFIRPYKGLRYAIEALPLILKKIDGTLLIVGEFWKDKQIYLKLIEDLKISQKIKVIDKYIPNEDIRLYFSACDIVLLPYISATGSAIVQIAFGFNKPVIASRVGCLPEVVSHRRTGYLVNPKDSQAIAEAVIDYYEENKEQEFTRNIKEEKDRFSWNRLVEVIESF